jgi:hypothetical protein
MTTWNGNYKFIEKSSIAAIGRQGLAYPGSDMADQTSPLSANPFRGSDELSMSQKRHFGGTTDGLPLPKTTTSSSRARHRCPKLLILFCAERLLLRE